VRGAAVAQLVVLRVPERELAADEVGAGGVGAEDGERIDHAVAGGGQVEADLGMREVPATEPGAAHVEEEEAADVAQDAYREGERVDQREAELEVGERHPAAVHFAEIVAAQVVQAAERVDAVAVPLADVG